jgi:hypothetical protein
VQAEKVRPESPPFLSFKRWNLPCLGIPVD